MATVPSRTFDGTPGQPSVSPGGPNEIEVDIDSLIKVINPGVAGGGIDDTNIQNVGITGSTKLKDLSVPAGKIADGAGTDIKIGNRTVDQAQTPTGNVGTLTQLFSWIVNRIKAITGTTNWYDAPATTLNAANTHYGATTGIHGVGASTIESVSGSQEKVNTHKTATPLDHADYSVTSIKIGGGAVTEEKIASGAVTMFKIADDSISTAKIQIGAVFESKLANNAATDVKIGNRTVDQEFVPTGNTNALTYLLSGLANRIKDIKKTTNWYDDALPHIDVAITSYGDFSVGALGLARILYPWAAPNKLADPANVPSGYSYSTAWSPNGEFLAVAYNASPYIIIYQRTSANFIKLTDPGTLPTGIAHSAAWSPNGEFLAVAHSVSPYITIYQRSGTTFTKLANPGTLPAGAGNGCAWSPSGEFLAVAHDNSPYITIYQRSGTTFTKLANPGTLPAGAGYGCAWSSNSEFLAIAHIAPPYITIYQRSGTTFTKLADPGTLPTGTGRGVSWSPNNEFVALAFNGTPYIFIYRTTGSPSTKGIMVVNFTDAV